MGFTTIIVGLWLSGRERHERLCRIVQERKGLLVLSSSCCLDGRTVARTVIAPLVGCECCVW